MYVGVKTTVIDRIVQRVSEIRRDNRDPEYVAVTYAEYDEMRSDRRSYSYFADEFTSFLRPSDPVPSTATITTRDFPARNPDQWRRDSLRVPQRGTFMDIPLFIVPPEYMPR